GTPQGAIISPLLANIVLNEAMDSYVRHWRKRHARGEVYIVRYADDAILSFEHKADADALRTALEEQLQRYGLDKRVFGLVIDFGTSQSPKSTRPLTTYLCPSRPGHPALRNNFASSLLLRTWLPMTGRRVRRPTLFSLWRKARRENSAASRLLGSTSLRFALHGWQRLNEAKTHLRRFGRNSSRGGGRSETFDFLGLTHIAGKDRRG
ncbi:reverse transcriptase domain-containing protein, partial [Thiolapillus sp.]|uniref:reverse transcriptase domain-containing protein n=1 Tax=Thiolapillus sp. TaxID=2017437 RepID=UPI003AF9601E